MSKSLLTMQRGDKLTQCVRSEHEGIYQEKLNEEKPIGKGSSKMSLETLISEKRKLNLLGRKERVN